MLLTESRQSIDANQGGRAVERSKLIAIAELSRIGFQVDEIPECASKRADLRVADGERVYHIECKDKFDASDIPNAGAGEFFRRKDPLTHNNTISGVLHKAHGQLRETPKTEGTFQLIWLHAETDLQWRQVFATFYGNVPLSALYPHRDKSTECFYFKNSAAFAMPDVEALILTEGLALHICLNEFSARRTEFLATRLFQTLSSGAIDPVTLETDGKIIRLRSNVSRKDEQVVIAALKAQTGIDFVPIPLTRYSF
jgi:hypothetical protein